MDQDSFRLLLKTSEAPSNSPSGSRGNLLSSTSSKSKKVDASQPVFKPRKVKKATAEGKYRDRAAERREGGGNDYAHVEAILDDFERRNAGNDNQRDVEEKRKYLGGDGEHSILVKGLDMALLEQNRARAAQESTEDDDTLERAYLEASSTVPKKRTREHLIRELKQKRAQRDQSNTGGEPEAQTPRSAAEEAKMLEEGKKQGKFKPIGFKPIGSEEGKKKKKAKMGESVMKGNGERRKKKRKVEDSEAEGAKAEVPKPIPTPTEQPLASSMVQHSQKAPESEPEPEPLGDDFDIFAGAGDYDGIGLGDEDEEDEAEPKSPPSKSTNEHRDAFQEPVPASSSRKWIVTEDDEPPIPSKPFLPSLPPHKTSGPKHSPSWDRTHSQGLDSHNAEMADGEIHEHEEVEEQQQPMRLQALESSHLPSIRDFLAMDEAAEAAEKRRKRKEKKKAGGGGASKSMEAKVNRDFQRLQSYTSKKEGTGPQ